MQYANIKYLFGTFNNTTPGRAYGPMFLRELAYAGIDVAITDRGFTIANVLTRPLSETGRVHEVLSLVLCITLLHKPEVAGGQLAEQNSKKVKINYTQNLCKLAGTQESYELLCLEHFRQQDEERLAAPLCEVCSESMLPGVLFGGCVIERCDECALFDSDVEAGRALAALLGLPMKLSDTERGFHAKPYLDVTEEEGMRLARALRKVTP